MSQNLTFNDMVSNSFIGLQGSIQKISSIEILINLGMSFLVGMFIFYIYKKTFQGVLYQKSFNISLVAISMITSLIIMTISGNLVLSLGMVGALSIVRFRTPIKDPVDLVFIFWAITVGIANGVGYFNISIIGSVVITIILLWMTKQKDNQNSYLLVLHLLPNAKETEIMEIVKNNTSQYVLRSKTITPSYSEITMEVSLKGQDSAFVQQLNNTNQVEKSTLLIYEQEYSNT